MTGRRLILFLVLVFVPTLALAQEPTEEATPSMLEPGPDFITLADPSLMPEGIEYDAERDVFLVGSLSRGNVNRVTLDGEITELGNSEQAASIVGLEVDEARGRLLAAANNQAEGTTGLAIFDLETGEQVAYVDLSALIPDAEGYFANDVAVDADGNAYVTDSANGAIYLVDAEGNPSIFLMDESFVGQFIVNGIAYHPDGYLVAVRSPGLIKIPLDAPESFTAIESQDELAPGDGLIFLDDDTLILVSSQENRVLRLESSDDFATVSVSGEFRALPDSSTTAAIRGDEIYIVYAKFGQQNVENYAIQKVVFEEIAG